MQEATARINVLQGEVEMTRSQLAAANAATADKVDALDRSSAEVTSKDLRAPPRSIDHRAFYPRGHTSIVRCRR